MKGAESKLVAGRVWTIELNGVSRKWKKIDFGRKLDMNSPTKFTAQIYYDETKPVNFMDVVKIKRDGVVEWKGYIEGIEPKWDQDGNYLYLDGRDTGFILWKKYTESFDNYVASGVLERDLTTGLWLEPTNAFFGSVNPKELQTFLMRTPCSDPVSGYPNSYPNNKEGWGLDISRIRGCSASYTSYGDPNNIILRRSGFGWRNSGWVPAFKTLQVDNAAIDSWTGIRSNPYLNDPTFNSYIDSGTTANEIATFGFDSFGITNVKSVDSLIIKVYWKTAYYPWNPISGHTIKLFGGKLTLKFGADDATCDCYVWIQSAGSWEYIFTVGGRVLSWTPSEMDITNLLSTDPSTAVNDINNLKVRFINTSTGRATYISYTTANVSFKQNGDQKAGDWFEIDFATENICGIYFESRMDDESYPRNYKIVSRTSNANPIAGSGFTESDPNGHIGVSSDDLQINWTNIYGDTNTWNYKDFGAGGLSSFTHKIGFKITYSDYADYAATWYCISNTIHSRYEFANGSYDYFAIDLFNDAFTGLLKLRAAMNGQTEKIYATGISLNKNYYLKVVKSSTSIDWYVYDDLTKVDGIQAIWHDSFSCAINFQYEFNVLYYGNTEMTEVFFDDFETAYYSVFPNYGKPWNRQSIDSSPYVDTSIYHSATNSCKFIALASQSRFLEKDLGHSTDLQFQFWMYPQTARSSESINMNLPVNAFDYPRTMQVDWSGMGAEPWLNTDDADTSYIRVYNSSSFLGRATWSYDFANLGNKYKDVYMTAGKLRLKGRLWQDSGGNPTAMSFRAYGSYNGVSYFYLGDFPNFISTSYAEVELDILNYLQTQDQINNFKIKIVFSGREGSDGGEGRLSYCYLHIEGTGYWGTVAAVAKVFNTDVAGQNSPTSQVHAGMSLTGMSGGWTVGLWGYNDAGTQWGTVSTYGAPVNEWHQWMIYVHAGNGDGYVQLQYWNGSSWVLACQQTGLYNLNILGQPNCICIGPDCNPDASLTVNFDDVYVFESNAGKGSYLILTSIDYQETIIIPEITGNSYRDLIHSWKPQILNNLRIEITEDSLGNSWAISQIYIYKAQVGYISDPSDLSFLKYRVYLDGFPDPSTDSSTPPASYVYHGGPYVKAISIEDFVDEEGKALPIGPLNISRQRLLDAMNTIDQQCADKYYNFEPYTWWMSLDDNNTFNAGLNRGSDKSSTISFVKGTNLGKNDYEKYTEDTVQRIYIVAKGQDKSQEDVSRWIDDSSFSGETNLAQNGMNDVRTFYEDIEQEKSVVNSDVATLLGKVYLFTNAQHRDQITAVINDDPYDSMSYDVGDYVKVIDDHTNTNGSWQIMNVDVAVDYNGEVFTLTLGYPKYRHEDEMQRIYRHIKAIGTIGLSPDWTAQGPNTDKVNAKQIDETTSFTQSAKNEELDSSSDSRDPLWAFVQAINAIPAPNSSGYQAVTASANDGREWDRANKWMAMMGVKSGSTAESFEVFIRGAGPDKTGSDIDFITIPMDRQPKFTADIKIMQNPVDYSLSTPANDGINWNTGDEFDIGFKDVADSPLISSNIVVTVGNRGFWFSVKCEGSQGTVFNAYSNYNLTGRSEDTVSRYMRTLDVNHKYRFEIVTETPQPLVANPANVVMFYIIDIDNLSPYGDLTPAIAIAMLADVPTSYTVKPLYMRMQSTPYNNVCQARIYIYNYKTSWKPIVGEAT